jgi:hypothetical protein
MTKIECIGLQLYTVRTEMEKSVEDPLREAGDSQAEDLLGFFERTMNACKTYVSDISTS